MSIYTQKEQHLIIPAPNLAAHDGIAHGFFTRKGGVSKGIYDSLNCGLGSKDDRQRILQNRAIVAGLLDSAADHLVANAQIHSTEVIHVTRPWAPENAPHADGLVTEIPGILLTAAGADCGVVLFYDPKAHIAGVCHAGWRGAKNGILESTIAAMETLGASAPNIVTALGPTISRPAYEVGIDMIEQVVASTQWAELCFDPSPTQKDKFYFDLPLYIEKRLHKAGVSNFHNIQRCTLSEPEFFFSYRRSTLNNEPDYGRHLHGIRLQPQ